ncbi:ral guanine nucleotide dissociation stimulator-like [Sorex araneus]|uniref:ral guanine nucleotide dissociation stimulator-like n=1 Tax=Sorex araneus TaxID=42254 RepID=UPI002433A690|nr:ral guanine nucleotide dissociation stimulator-like [Sorex araneus]
MSGSWPEGSAEWLCCVPVQPMLGCILVHFSGSGLQVHLRKELLLTALIRAQDIAPAPAVVPEPPEELGLPPRDAPEPEPLEASAAAAAQWAELEDAGPGDTHDASSWAAASRASEAADGPEPSCPGSRPLEEPGNEQVSVSTFPARLVAEQLTLMDKELFLELVPNHCRGDLSSIRNKPGYEHVCPTVRAIESQYYTVAACVLTTCLSELSPPARARMLEYWILVAQECQRLRNWASTYAIICALQSPAIRRLCQTWGHVSWWSRRKLKALRRQARKHRRCKPLQVVCGLEDCMEEAGREGRVLFRFL